MPYIQNGLEIKVEDKTYRFWSEKPKKIENFQCSGIYTSQGKIFKNYSRESLKEKIAEKLGIVDEAYEYHNKNEYALADALVKLISQGKDITDFVLKDIVWEQKPLEIESMIVWVSAIGYKPKKKKKK